MIDVDGREAANAHHGGPSPEMPQTWEDTWKSERQNESWAMGVGKHLVGKCADKTATNIYIHAKFLRILTERYGPLAAWAAGTYKEIEDFAQGQSPAETAQELASNWKGITNRVPPVPDYVRRGWR